MKTSKFLTGALVACMAMSNVQFAFAETEQYAFSDVGLDNPYYEEILFLKEKGIISGYPDGTFKPNQVVNRAESLKMIMGVDKLKYWDRAEVSVFASGDPKPMKFTDIDKNAWYYEYLQEAFNNDLIAGYPDGTFKPAQTVNTVENLKILLNHTFLRIDNLNDVKVYEDPYMDADYTQWYGKYVQYAKEHNLLTPDAANKIYPAAGMTRGKLAEAIYKAYMADKHMATKTGVVLFFNDNLGKYIVAQPDNELTQIAQLPGDYTTNDEVEATIEKVTANYAYVSICATGFGGYIHYGFCYGTTYRVDLKTGAVVDADTRADTTASLSFTDVSPDEKWTVWKSNDNVDAKIYLLPAPGNSNEVAKTFDVNAKYNAQYGEAKFAEDGKTIVYAGIEGVGNIGEETQEKTGVFTIDLATGKQTTVVEGNGVFHVYGFDAYGMVDYGTEYTGW